MIDIPPMETGLASTALALLILREVFSFMKERKSNGANGLKIREEMKQWTEVEKSLTSLTENIRKLSHTINNQTQTMTAVLFKIKYDVQETRQQIKDAVIDCRKK
jgi:gas vesicle protein